MNIPSKYCSGNCYRCFMWHFCLFYKKLCNWIFIEIEYKESEKQDKLEGNFNYKEYWENENKLEGKN